ncbi:MAG: DUF6088 family protein [Candidatus Marinimicrobia bacterium]|nr:DUF6088 family protein [Candidatus Neomarinimicrobiota bacterium]
MKVTEKIAKKIKRMKEGSVFGYTQLGIEPDEFVAAAKALERFVKNETIGKVSKGKFYKPKETVFGKLKPREDELLKLYLFSGRKQVAYITGTALFNRLGLTTQVPKVIKVASQDKRISINNGSLRVKSVTGYVRVTNDNVYLLELLDVMKDFSKIPDLDKDMAIRYLKGRLGNLSGKEKSKIVTYALEYPPRVRALLGLLLSEIGSCEKIEKLKESLNPLSKYDYGLSSALVEGAAAWGVA